MLLVIYDISDNRLRTKFAKLLKKYGQRVQYSSFEIKNSDRILTKLMLEIDKKFKPKFGFMDSIRIYPITDIDAKKTIKLGYASNENQELLIFE